MNNLSTQQNNPVFSEWRNHNIYAFAVAGTITVNQNTGKKSLNFIFPTHNEEFDRYRKATEESEKLISEALYNNQEVPPLNIDRSKWDKRGNSYIPKDDTTDPYIVIVYTGFRSDLWCIDIDNPDIWAKLITLVKQELGDDYPGIVKSFSQNRGGHLYFKYPPKSLGLNPNIYTAAKICQEVDNFLDLTGSRCVFAPCSGNSSKIIPKNWVPNFSLPTDNIIKQINTLFNNYAKKSPDLAYHGGGKHGKKLEPTARRFGSDLIDLLERTKEQLKDKGDSEFYFLNQTIDSEMFYSASDKISWWYHPENKFLHTLMKFRGSDAKAKYVGKIPPYHQGYKHVDSTQRDYRAYLNHLTLTLAMDRTVSREVFTQILYLYNNMSKSPFSTEEMQTVFINPIIGSAEGKESTTKWLYDPEWNLYQGHSSKNVNTGHTMTLYEDVDKIEEGKTQNLVIINEDLQEIDRRTSPAKCTQDMAMATRNRNYSMHKEQNDNVSVATEAEPLEIIKSIFEQKGFLPRYDQSRPLGTNNPLSLNIARTRPLVRLIQQGREGAPEDGKWAKLSEHEVTGTEYPAIKHFFEALHGQGQPEYASAARHIWNFLGIKCSRNFYSPITITLLGTGGAGKNLFYFLVPFTILTLTDLNLLSDLTSPDRVSDDAGNLIENISVEDLTNREWVSCIFATLDDFAMGYEQMRVYEENYKKVTGSQRLTERQLYSRRKLIANYLTIIETLNRWKTFSIKRDDRRRTVFRVFDTLEQTARKFYEVKDNSIDTSLPQEIINALNDPANKHKADDILNTYYKNKFVAQICEELPFYCLGLHEEVYKPYMKQEERKVNSDPYLDFRQVFSTPMKEELMKGTEHVQELAKALTGDFAHHLFENVQHLDTDLFKAVCAYACLNHELQDGETTDSLILFKHLVALRQLRQRDYKKISDEDKDTSKMKNQMRLIEEFAKEQNLIVEEKYHKIDYNPETETDTKILRLHKPNLADELRSAFKSKHPTAPLPKHLKHQIEKAKDKEGKDIEIDNTALLKSFVAEYGSKDQGFTTSYAGSPNPDSEIFGENPDEATTLS